MVGMNPWDLTPELSKFGEVDITSTERIEMETTQRKFLNPEEEKLLTLLVDRGFFTLPTRGTTLGDIAKELSISDSKLSMDLRAISAKVFTEYLRRASEVGKF
jgi:predicted DNA binding protein